MQIARIGWQHFRNLADGEIELEGGVNLIEGPNAQGKTNLLEAVAMLAWGRSPRTQHDAQVWTSGQQGYRLDALVQRRSGAFRIAVEASAQRRRRWLRGGLAHRAGADPLGSLRAILFWPDHLELVKGGPQARRDFVDEDLGQISPRYLSTVRRYDRIVASRNALLRRGDADPAVLDAWDAQLSEAGLAVRAFRDRAVGAIAPLAARSYAAMAGESVRLSVRYVSGVAVGVTDEPGYREALVKLRALDQARGVTTMGPHRDDISLSIGTRDARSAASQGEQRTVALSLKWAAHRWLQDQENDEAPVLLLDDVLSELDEQRRAGLTQLIQEGQVLLTRVPNETLPPGVGVGRRFEVHAGVIRRAAP